MKKKLIFGLIFLLLAFGFLEAQYHFFLRTNRYWSNAGIFSTDNRIQSVGSNNALRVAYSPSVYREFTIDSDAIIDLDGPMLLNYAPTGTSGYNLIEVDYDVEGIVTDSARGIYAHVTNRSDTAITGELTGGEFKVRSQDSDTTSVKGIHVSIDAKANTITTGRGIEISIDAGESEHGGITTAQGLRIAHNSSGAHTTITGIVIEGPGTWTYGIDLNAGTTTTDLRLSNGALIHNTSTSVLTITEAETAFVGKATITHAAVPSGERAFEIDATQIAAGAGSYGYAAYLCHKITGAASGVNIGTGIWSEITGSGAPTSQVRALDIGIYTDDSADTSGATLIGLAIDMSVDDAQNPLVFPMRFNCVESASGGSVPDAWFIASNVESVCAETEIQTMDTNQIGTIRIRIGSYYYRIPLVAD